MFTEQELAELKEYDKLVDKGVDLYPLNPQQKQVEKEMRSVGMKTVKSESKPKREKKSDKPKADLIAQLNNYLASLGASDFEIVNPEREFNFELDNRKYKIVLSCPRK